MTTAIIEHINLTVADTGASARMLMDLFGWEVRWEEDHPRGGHVIHVGTEAHYVALYQHERSPSGPHRHAKGVPLNHVGVQVADFASAEARITAAGFEIISRGDYDPGPRSIYFLDHDGIEWEVVSYTR
jgi:catechol 2,3-dioxygenase-like lactoylglutathione lyase family enzyme